VKVNDFFYLALTNMRGSIELKCPYMLNKNMVVCLGTNCTQPYIAKIKLPIAYDSINTQRIYVTERYHSITRFYNL